MNGLITPQLTGTANPLDPGLNTAILETARRLFPCGFDVADQAPTSRVAAILLLRHGAAYT